MRFMLFLIRSSTSVPLQLKKNVANGLKKKEEEKKKIKNKAHEQLQMSAIKMQASVPWHPQKIYAEIG